MTETTQLPEVPGWVTGEAFDLWDSITTIDDEAALMSKVGYAWRCYNTLMDQNAVSRADVFRRLADMATAKILGLVPD